MRIAELEDENERHKDAIEGALTKMVRVGGPMNDNKRRFTQEQLAEWSEVMDILQSAG